MECKRGIEEPHTKPLPHARLFNRFRVCDNLQIEDGTVVPSYCFSMAELFLCELVGCG